jgi:hypothetical protein
MGFYHTNFSRLPSISLSIPRILSARPQIVGALQQVCHFFIIFIAPFAAAHWHYKCAHRKKAFYHFPPISSCNIIFHTGKPHEWKENSRLSSACMLPMLFHCCHCCFILYYAFYCFIAFSHTFRHTHTQRYWMKQKKNVFKSNEAKEKRVREERKMLVVLNEKLSFSLYILPALNSIPCQL